jgi:D-methionine transport system substrate-binding protein
VHLEPFGLYSRRHSRLEDLPDGAMVALPSDVSNGHRALRLLERAGLIELDKQRGFAAGVRDIVHNPRQLRFKEADAAIMPRLLHDVDIAGVNTNFAMAAGLQPVSDALVHEAADSPYANVLVARRADVDRPALRQLAAALRSSEVRDFLAAQYGGAVLPAF